MKTRTYYTLVARDSKDQPWTPQFGDYDFDVVKDEQLDTRGDWKYARIVVSKADQASIDAAIAALNAPEK